MQNPKVRIESDGFRTEIYVDGVKVDRATQCFFFAEPFKAECEVEKYKINETGNIIIDNDEAIKESITILGEKKSK